MRSKGKEQATDPPAIGKMRVHALASLLRKLNVAIDASALALRLDPSNADEALKDRARRTEKIQ